MRSVFGLFLGYIFSNAIILVILFSLFIKKFNFNRISLPFLKEAIKYSFPLIWTELSLLLLNFGDRYVLQFFMGSEAVGIYSAGYNVSNMAHSFLATPLRLAIIPMYLSLWNTRGEDETKDFLSRILNYYFMLGIPILIGLTWFGEEIIVLLATSKFQESAIIIPFIIVSLILYGTQPILAAGIYIYKRTVILMYLSLSAGLINLLLNFFLIPKFGVLGASYATLITNILLVLAIIISSYRLLSIRIQINPIFGYIFLSIIIVYIVSQITSETIPGLLLKIFITALVYMLCIIVCDKELREKALSVIKS
jgi:O-antigen/teichoic acid export membrane protein